METANECLRIVVVGAGMVAHRFIESLLAEEHAGPDREAAESFGVDVQVTVVGEERYLPYDRVALTSYFTGSTAEDLTLDENVFDDPRITVELGHPAVEIDRADRSVTLRNGKRLPFDHLVIATGSSAATLGVEGDDLPGCFVYRTLDDVRSLRDFVRQRREELGRPLRGCVIGGGLLGLEAAGALDGLDVPVTVVQSSDRLMSSQLDLPGGAVLGRLIEEQGISVRLKSRTTRCLPADTTAAVTAPHSPPELDARADPSPLGRLGGVEFSDGSRLPADIVVVTVGVRPRDELARAAGLACGESGGVVIDPSCRTNDPAIWAIGEVASFKDTTVGLVAPGYAMAEVAARGILGDTTHFPGYDLATKLKLSGVEVASFGDVFGDTPGALDVVYQDPVAGVYKKLVMSDDAQTLLGGIFVGDAEPYGQLRPLAGGPLGGDPSEYLAPSAVEDSARSELPDDAIVCSCSTVTAGRIRESVHEEGCVDAAGVKGCTKAGSTCGSCIFMVAKIVDQELAKTGRTASKSLCEHFDMSRRQLFDSVRVSGLTTFSAIIDRFGTGRGCDVCKPALASILAVTAGTHVLEGENATLQDTNDHVMANLQKNGTYSVVPRMPGGEVTPEGLITVGEIAKEFGLYTKITGGQRIDMFGARLEQLPLIWKRLVDAGFESGHAYGKSLRTVKSCVGSTWCRYGVQDSVGMAIDLELRYRGLRAPHKLKVGVSGCARECAEARAKDVGVIATEKGWNLYVGGNGGFTPRHAQLLVEGVDDATLVRTIDRFFMYYIRTADRLQRTAPWVEEIEGGLDGLRAVIMDDSLGICADLDDAMARHIEGYEDEWAATLADEDKLARFQSFVNAPTTPDPTLEYVTERGQPRPALIAGPTLEVRK